MEFSWKHLDQPCKISDRTVDDDQASADNYVLGMRTSGSLMSRQSEGRQSIAYLHSAQWSHSPQHDVIPTVRSEVLNAV